MLCMHNIFLLLLFFEKLWSKKTLSTTTSEKLGTTLQNYITEQLMNIWLVCHLE